MRSPWRCEFYSLDIYFKAVYISRPKNDRNAYRSRQLFYTQLSDACVSLRWRWQDQDVACFLCKAWTLRSVFTISSPFPGLQPLCSAFLYFLQRQIRCKQAFLTPPRQSSSTFPRSDSRAECLQSARSTNYWTSRQNSMVRNESHVEASRISQNSFPPPLGPVNLIWLIDTANAPHLSHGHDRGCKTLMFPSRL